MKIVPTLRKAAFICVVPLAFGAYSGLGSNIESVSLEPDSALVSQSAPSPIRLDQTAKWRAAAAARNVPISFTLMMWEDGAVSRDSLDLF